MPGPKCHFKVYDKNPNPGEACLCSPDAKCGDCTGPFVVFSHSEVVSGRNPYAVIGKGCLGSAARKTGAAPAVKPAPVTVLRDDAREAELSRLAEQIKALTGGK